MLAKDRPFLYHGHTATANLLINTNGQIYLIDLEGLEFVGEIPLSRVQADLARLFKSALDHPEMKEYFPKTFLEAYCEKRGLSVESVV